MTEASSDLEYSIAKLQSACSAAITETLQSDGAPRIGKCFAFLSDLEIWSEILASRPEVSLHKTACSEYTLAIFNLAQAQYRNAFKGLRLVLELVLQATYASANLLELKEWLAGGRHTNWARIVHNGDGLFSKRVCNAFFEELGDEAASYRSISETLYTELSECIHGNVDKRIPLPASLEFSDETCELWLEKCETIQRIAQFALSMRYLKELDKDQRAKLEHPVLEQIGHIAPVRACFGGVQS